RVSDEIVIPGRIVRRARFRCDDDDATAVLTVDQGRRVSFPALGSLVSQKKHRCAGERTADLAAVGAKLLDHLLIELGHRIRHLSFSSFRARARRPQSIRVLMRRLISGLLKLPSLNGSERPSARKAWVIAC